MKPPVYDPTILLNLLSNYRRDGLAVPFIIEDRGYETPCWIWQRRIQVRGYAEFSVTRDSSGLVHRYAYKVYIGPIPDGLQIDHLCKVKCCVNPAHLEPTTNAINCRRSKKTVLTWEIVDKIRQTRADTGLSYEKIGKMFDISRWHCWQICAGKRWSAV